MQHFSSSNVKGRSRGSKITVLDFLHIAKTRNLMSPRST